jgi:single-strand DNA-binding protein
LNKAIIIGNLTRDPETRVTGEHKVCTFTVAVQRRFKRDEADFIPVVTWRKLAENCEKYLCKGLKVAVAGEIRTRSYDAQDGTKRYVTEIQADEVQFLERKSEACNAPDMDKPLPDFSQMDDQELPF